MDNLHYPNGTAMIPVGAMVYISTDDPDGLCKGCLVNRKPCESYATPKPPGCPEDVSLSTLFCCFVVAEMATYAREFPFCPDLPTSAPN